MRPPVHTFAFLALVALLALFVAPNDAGSNGLGKLRPSADLGTKNRGPAPGQTPGERTSRPPLNRPPFAGKTKTPNLDSPQIPPKTRDRSGYGRSVRKMIRAHNKAGRAVGDIKLYAKENRWGAAVRIQSCYGDNILTRFSVSDKGDTGRVWFQFKDVTHRNRRRRRHKWLMVEPGILMRGRTLYLRAQSSKGNAVISLKVVGNCIESPPRQ